MPSGMLWSCLGLSGPPHDKEVPAKPSAARLQLRNACAVSHKPLFPSAPFLDCLDSLPTASGQRVPSSAISGLCCVLLCRRVRLVGCCPLRSRLPDSLGPFLSFLGRSLPAPRDRDSQPHLSHGNRYKPPQDHPSCSLIHIQPPAASQPTSSLCNSTAAWIPPGNIICWHPPVRYTLALLVTLPYLPTSLTQPSPLHNRPTTALCAVASASSRLPSHLKPYHSAPALHHRSVSQMATKTFAQVVQYDGSAEDHKLVQDLKRDADKRHKYALGVNERDLPFYGGRPSKPLAPPSKR